MSEKRKKESQKFPDGPEKTYASEWASWYEFLDDGESIEKYSRPLQAKLPASKLRFIAPRLPTSPCQVYENDWISWHDFRSK
ncbi:integrase repeat-containing protein [Pseudomonas taiwanensis]|uniref:Uncharacterized protein n=1 Tax=Pseudomonas taiwanensis TaxID=470150 RepID=A0ABR6V8G8_9PSED|nr:hypothetical protein [Pseudomonas taiwanensis]